MNVRSSAQDRQQNRPPAGKGEIRGVHVALIVVGLIVVVFGVNGFFLARAISTFPGEVAPKSYLQGLAYNDAIARREAQRDLGWRAEAGLRGEEVVVRMTGAASAPLDDLVVTVKSRVGGAPQADADLKLEPRGNGEYAAALPVVTGRRTELSIEARRKGQDALVFEAVKNVVAP